MGHALFHEHQDASGGDEQGANDHPQVHLLVEEDEGEEDGDDDAELVDGGYSGDIAQLDGLEVEKP